MTCPISDRSRPRPLSRRPPRRRIARAAALAAGLAAAVALASPGSPAAAQSPGGAPDAPADTAARSPGPGSGPAEGRGGAPGHIDGFWGLPWHADSATVAGKLGPPITAGRKGDGLRMFVYTPLYLGRDGFLQLWVHDRRGLVAGTWEPMTSDCSGMLRRLVRETKRVHPEISVRTEGSVRRGMLGQDVCVAAMEQGASVTVLWEDPDGVRIAIGTTAESHKLRMRAWTPAFRDLAGGRGL